jgi:hypothetical protein
LIMTDASRDYRDNMYGMSSVSQFLKRKKKKDDAVKVECGKADGEECGSTLGGNETVRKAPKKKRGMDSEGEKNEVMTKKEADDRAVDFEKNRQEAVPMVNKTRKQLEEEDEQAKADYKKYGRNKPVSASNKSKY